MWEDVSIMWKTHLIMQKFQQLTIKIIIDIVKPFECTEQQLLWNEKHFKVLPTL